MTTMSGLTVEEFGYVTGKLCLDKLPEDILVVLFSDEKLSFRELRLVRRIIYEDMRSGK